MALQRHKWQRFVLLCLFLCSIGEHKCVRCAFASRTDFHSSSARQVAAAVVGGSQLRYLISPSDPLGRIVVISRCVYWGLSLVINLLCTCLIACTTWSARRAHLLRAP